MKNKQVTFISAVNKYVLKHKIVEYNIDYLS